MTRGSFGDRAWWATEDDHLAQRAEEMVHRYGNTTKAEQAFKRDSVIAANRDASSQSPVHINTSTVIETDKLGDTKKRHTEGEITKYSKTMQYFTVKGADGRMRTANRSGTADGLKRVDIQRKLDMQAEAKELEKST